MAELVLAPQVVEQVLDDPVALERERGQCRHVLLSPAVPTGAPVPRRRGRARNEPRAPAAALALLFMFGASFVQGFL